MKVEVRLFGGQVDWVELSGERSRTRVEVSPLSDGGPSSVMKFQARNLPDQIFLRNLCRSFKLAACSPVSSGPLGLPLMIEILVPPLLHSRLCHVVIDEVWLAFPQWCTISSTQRNKTKSHEWAPQSCSNCSSDSCSSDSSCPARALTIL
jgi:hypothetical protein